MPIMLQSNHALFFDGVSDGVIIPQGVFSKLGRDTADGDRSASDIISTSSQGARVASAISDALGGQIAIEAWVTPDCGGVVLSKDKQFQLSIGSVDTPGPAVFEVNIISEGGVRKVILSTATTLTTGYDGTVYPSTTYGGFEDSYNRFDAAKDDATNLNINQRPLIHIVAAVTNGAAVLYINGELMAREAIPGNYTLPESDEHVYIGGSGGQFRGVIENIHISAVFSNEMVTRNAALVGEDTLALFRFEEPIDPIEGTFTINSISADSNLSAINISTSDAALLASKLTGTAVTAGIIDFTSSPYSSGNYAVVDYKTTPGTKQTHAVPHVPYNLLINPGAIRRESEKPNQSPPERVRLHRINVDTGAILVSSVHLDFGSSTNGDGLRPVLHTRSAATGDNYFVVVAADLLLDNGTGRPYQPPHLASQLIDRTGQMVLDESDLEQHGIVFSSRMATTSNDPNNPFAVVWPSTLNESFQIGHSGRHTLNHVIGHHYLRNMPRANEEILDQQVGNADIVELLYDEGAKGIEKQFPINSRVDYYRDIAQSRIVNVVSTSTVHEAVDNGLTGASRRLIAIGGAGSTTFDPMPFVLKGPVPQKVSEVDANMRKHHLRPSATSRVAILEVDLSSYGMAPFVEIHYNAIDFTGVSMNKTAPMLMVEKTVPASNLLLSTGPDFYVIDAIEAALGSATIHAPGGILEVADAHEGGYAQASFSHALVGDNSEGYESDDELDERYTPQNYATVRDEPRRPPQNISASHTTKTAHESVFHHIIVEANAAEDFVPPVRSPGEEIASPSAGEFDIGIAASSGPVHEMFDIVDNHAVALPTIAQRIFVQPSDRRRTAQLRHIKTESSHGKDAHYATVMFLMTRARLRSVAEEESDDGGSRYTKVRCVGLNSAAVERSVDEIGSGSPDSHVVKEIDPNAPVVSVTLGGVGQGAYDTNPSFDPSALSRLPYNTRRGFSCFATSIRVDRNITAADRVQFIEVRALNNGSDDLKAWGTYPFPKRGRLYLKTGASAEYTSKNGVGFFFTDATVGSGRFVLPDGSEVANFYEWADASGLSAEAGAVASGSAGSFSLGEIILGDGNFYMENAASDGTTVNDRMFQSMDTVTHDYQLGTQFASTRALVEIPLFNEQFFENAAEGIFPGPDNSLKLHLDPTMTAHTWNPSPVGRRYPEVSPADRTAHAAYAYALSQSEHTRSASIQHRAEVVSGFYRLYVSNPDIFPAANINKVVGSEPDYFYVEEVQRHQRAFLPSGDWIIYENDPAADGYLEFEDEPWAYSENFLRLHEPGMMLLVGGFYQSESLVPLEGSPLSPSSAIERRSEYYHDSASVKTQGGNVDYGLRQYVSAVEFKAGPTTNPHAPRVFSGRARGSVLGVTPIMNGSTFTGLAVISLSEEDADLFPNISPTLDSNGNIVYETGDYHYGLETFSPDGTTRRFIYWGDASATFAALSGSPTSPEQFRNSILVEDIFNKGGALPNYLDRTQPEFILDQDALLTRRGFDLGYSIDRFSRALEDNLNISDTYRPPTGRHPWIIRATPTPTPVSITVTNPTHNGLLQANTTGLDVQVGDEVYVERYVIATGKTESVLYLGRVQLIDEGQAQAIPTTDTIITLDGSMLPDVLIDLQNIAADAALTAYLRVGCHNVMKNDDEAILNRSWLFPYAQGGLRHGDTVWANMTYNNPHAIEGLFAKSRGVFNEGLVWNEFNGGQGALSGEARDSLPLENFLIGNTCRETAINYAQHVNKTIEVNYAELGISNPPVVAYLDPMLNGDDHARVLLYDVAHDREFVAFQDLHMQVQTSAKVTEIGFQRHTTAQNIVDGSDQIDLGKYGIEYNGAGQHGYITQIDTAAGYPSQNKFVRNTTRSRFMESAYAHDLANHYAASVMKSPITGKVTALTPYYSSGANGSGYTAGTKATTTTGTGAGLTVTITVSGGAIATAVIASAGTGYQHNDVITVSGGTSGRFRVSVAPSGTSTHLTALDRITQYGKAHGHMVHTGYYTGGPFSERSIGDSIQPRTNDATVIPYWANEAHTYTRKVRSNLDRFIVALTLHREEKAGATTRDPSTLFDTPDGTRVVPAFLALRGIRSGALDLSSHDEQRLQHLKHWTEMDFTRRLTIDCGEVATRDGVTDIEAAAREVVRIINQAGAKNARTNLTNGETGSAFDPAVWWDSDKAFSTQDQGSHMGYFRAHLGRVVQDTKGREGFSVVIHSTVPGATGRNFAVWLDNARGQSAYQPEFLIGHGGRFRTFWCQPDELSGENMHPAPMPLNKHGRPFAPITSLRQYTLPDASSADVKSTGDFAQRGDESSDPVMRAMSMVTGSGQSFNTVNTESLEAEGYITNYTEGLRTGSQATGRVNFGGLVAAGIPGFAPDAGKWGFGRKGDKRFDKRYGDIQNTSGDTLPVTYTGHVPASQISHDAIGDSPLYGFQFIDHLGRRHGIRIVYRAINNNFTLDETQLPDTLEDEIVIYIDDRDVGQGGLTIGRHMRGLGDATGRFGANPSNATLIGWEGNRWNGVPSVNAAYDCKATYDSSAKTLTLEMTDPYNNCPHFDVLGYMGFPIEDGVIQVSDPFNAATAVGSWGHMFSYTSRTRNDNTGPHIFYGVEGTEFMTSHTFATASTVTVGAKRFGLNTTSIRALVSSCANWTTLVTDELLAAVVTTAINLPNPNIEEGVPFDCTEFFAADGRTLGQWGVAEDAIRIRAYNTARKVRPISDFFTATLHRDMAIQAAHVEHGDVQFVKMTKDGVTLPSSNNRAATDAQIDAGLRAECGYIPYTVVQVSTKGRGSNANTASPVLVDSSNEPVDTEVWEQNLNGQRFTAYSGDHILPMVNNPTLETDANDSYINSPKFPEVGLAAGSGKPWHFFRPAGNEGDTISSLAKVASFSSQSEVYFGNFSSALATTVNGGTASSGFTSLDHILIDEATLTGTPPDAKPSTDPTIQRYGALRAFRTAGVRVLGSLHSRSQVFFRGGRDSSDHWVPLFFGGGFSGVTIDVNDGSANDYSEKYTHPYANGPTGVAGIQHANETLSSFSLVDCNAIMAFFPGTALLNQHRGSINPPFFNQDSLLSPDIKGGTQTVHPDHPNPAPYTAGVAIQVPIPLVLRFAHPTARYNDHRDGVENKTTFLIFGPGQAFPFTQEEATPVNTYEPAPGRAITVGNTWSKVPAHTGSNTAFMPNHIMNDAGHYMPWTSTYQLNRGRFHWRQTINWEPAQGKPNVEILRQRPEAGRMYGEVFTSGATNLTVSNVHDYRMAHPNRHGVYMGFSMASSSDWCFHMDGGYHPGGSWMDNQITFNPPHPDDNSRVSKSAISGNELHPSAFRVAAPLATKILYGSSGAFVSETVTRDIIDMEYIAVDATRCQNGEELAALLGAAINTYPGGGALKAMGGTFLPSFSNAMKQDRYGWRELEGANIVDYAQGGGGIALNSSFITVDIGSNPDDGYNIPETGWIRTTNSFATTILGENSPAFAPYHSRIVLYVGGSYKVKFFLGQNRISGYGAFESVATWDNYLDGNPLTYPTLGSGVSGLKLYVWVKAGVHQWRNTTRVSGYGQVHFNGLVDAIDRTKPVGVAGWAGERYSYLNTLSGGLSGQYAAGLGAWHASLGFSPYGGSMGCASVLGHLPNITPMPNSPESAPPNNGSDGLATFPSNSNPDAPQDRYDMGTDSGSYTLAFTDSSDFNTPPIMENEPEMQKELTHMQGVFSRAMLVISHESELALVAKTDRDGQKSVGDWLRLVDAADVTKAGTVRWDDRIHGQDRFYAPAHAGPNVEALIHNATSRPTISDYTVTNALDGAPFDAEFSLHPPITAESDLENAEPCFTKTGDLFFDLDKSIGSHFSASAGAQRNVAANFYASASVQPSTLFGGTKQKNTFWVGDVNAYEMYARSPAKNFNIEHVVWKRMDGGSLSMPAVNARGLGAVPWVNRVSGGVGYTTGEKLLGNVRFSFETTNSAMLPVLQAQELAHPQLAEKHRIKLQNVLEIPNEHLQFEEMEVIDDTGQTHTLSGGSPLGVVIRAFRAAGERLASGLAPSVANTSTSPNLVVQLPDPESIPGNILVRSGFDRLQAYQNETMGDGGMIHPDLGASHLGHLFDNAISGPRYGPTMNEVGWEHIAEGSAFPDSTKNGWVETTGNRPLQSSYELHDRTLFFHVTKMGHSHTDRFPTVYTHSNGVETQSLTVSSYSSGVLTASATINSRVFDAAFASKEVSDNRRFLRLSSSGDSCVVSYTGISGDTFTGVVGDIDFTEFIAANPSATITPSYYIPAGSTRFFAARRLRDHAEVSGNSPDMAHTEYITGTALLAHTRYSKPQLTPMPMPRMGHHFVNATMPMLPGHWAHPAYQGLYGKHEAERRATLQDADLIRLLENVDPTTTTLPASVTDYLHPLNPQLRIGSLTATPSGPSDIHGGAFTLMFETKVRFDGYGVLASKGDAGDINKAGGHSIVLEAGANYTQDGHFPDPAEVGAYQIVIQPNLRKQQLTGFHHNNSDASALPDGTARELTGQQVHLVVGIKYDSERGTAIGAATLILSEATLADVRGCEIFVNEVILDHDPDHGSQFSNLPPMLLYNALGVQGSESPTFTRRSHPYHTSMFVDATPGYTLNIPWWSILHKNSPDDATATGFRHLALYRLDNYYEFCRASHGALGAQLTLGGYPSISPDIYSKVLANTSISPVATVQSTGVGYIQVDDASLFPEVPYYGQQLVYTDNDGVTQTLSYTKRTGLTYSSGTMNQPYRFITTALSLPSAGTVLRLSRPYSREVSTSLLTKSQGVLSLNLDQLRGGTRDTNSLYTPDAFVCAWHPNLGRPHTFYSDSSRTWGDATDDRAVDKAAYNSMPEHFETVHYHGVNYAASLGPFHLDFKTPEPPSQFSGTFQSAAGSPSTITMNADVSSDGASAGDYIFVEGKVLGKIAGGGISGVNIVLTTDILFTPAVGSKVYFGADGTAETAANIHIMSGYQAQGSNTVMLSHYWPSGSRGGPLVSRLDGYAAWSAAWNLPALYEAGGGKHWEDTGDAASYTASDGIGIASSLVSTRSYPFGYRFGLRQPWNRPQWGHYGMRAFTESSYSSSNLTLGYKPGPLVEYESQDWNYAGGAGLTPKTLPTTYVGVMERQTNFSGMLGPDKPEWQVRYSDGRRMTRSFGCPVRIIRNNADAPRDWWGDSQGLGIGTIEGAAGYYLVDWWGNTRGEDVRKAPVRGFGIRPAWDAGDAYEYDRTYGRSPYARLWNGGKPIVNFKGVVDPLTGKVLSSPTEVIPRFGGRLNDTNNNNAFVLVDVFAPTNAMRVGDMGGGRGVRYPTQFNEDVLTELSAVYEGSGVVLSHHTAEPTFGQGLLRPRDDVLQPDEVKRGISGRLEIAEDGLLKPEAAVSDRVESITGTSVHKEPISRSSPRIGIDADTLESFSTGINADMVAINSEAHSLHTDRGVGQRIVLQGGLQSGSQTLEDYDLTSLSFAAQPQGGVMRFSHTGNIKPMGGTYILESRSFVNPFDDTGWGRSGSGTTSNPYQTTTSTTTPHNLTDTTVRFMLRPVRLLDNQHIEVFRPVRAVASGTPQYGSTFYTATAGGKYGLFTYESTNASAGSYMRATVPDGNAPYQPVYLMESSSDTVPVSKGPKLPGSAMPTFDTGTLKSTVTRLLISENTLQHYRSDAPRRTGSGKDYSVKPRFSQSLHSKGHKADVTYNTSDHSGDAP